MKQIKKKTEPEKEYFIREKAHEYFWEQKMREVCIFMIWALIFSFVFLVIYNIILADFVKSTDPTKITGLGKTELSVLCAIGTTCTIWLIKFLIGIWLDANEREANRRAERDWCEEHGEKYTEYENQGNYY